MKQLCCIALTLFLLCLFLGCSNPSDNMEAPANFYYRNASITFFESDSVIAVEVRETVHQNADVQAILNAYLQGPVSDEFTTPFPEGLQISALEYVDDTIIITFNEQFSLLSGLDLSLACSCICATASELTGCETVVIVFSQPLSGEIQSITLNKDDLYLMDHTVNN